MSRIEQIKRQGMINQLKSEIDLQIWNLENKIFENVKSSDNFNKLDVAKLDVAIDKTKTTIKEIEDLLNALKELDEKAK